MKEIWKDITDHPNYQVSNTGKVKSLARVEICGGRAKVRVRKEKILKPGIDRGGYFQVALCLNGKAHSKKIHRLVLLAFDTEQKPSINHKNGDKKDNSLTNLEWCSVSQNAIHAYDTGLYKSGSKHYRAKLSDNDVTEIKTSQLSVSKLAKKFKISMCGICDILAGRTWKRHTLQEKGALSGTSPLSTSNQ